MHWLTIVNSKHPTDVCNFGSSSTEMLTAWVNLESGIVFLPLCMAQPSYFVIFGSSNWILLIFWWKLDSFYTIHCIYHLLTVCAFSSWKKHLQFGGHDYWFVSLTSHGLTFSKFSMRCTVNVPQSTYTTYLCILAIIRQRGCRVHMLVLSIHPAVSVKWCHGGQVDMKSMIEIRWKWHPTSEMPNLLLN